ncbi:MAG: 16S rRNA (cytosine(1402)-N(4))-methyltransferase RsmH [Patescibacteria group bacterium]|mgnify:CR=1 FL=1
MNSFHESVLLKEIIENLGVEEGKRYIDATLGGGGHAVEILKRGGVVLGIDCDREAIEHIKKILREKDIKILSEKKDKALNILVSQYPNITLVKGNFRDIDKIAHSHGFEKVAGIIFDLGVSSYQLETAERGFSFQKEGPLDMRMDQDLGISAADLIKILTKGELYELFSKLGEESNARNVSEHIVRARRVKPIETTQELVEIIGEVKPPWRFSSIHPATKIFQALRIAVNDELNALKEALPKGVKLLAQNGRLLVISFQSLEDRIVKQSFIKFSKNGLGKIITKKPIVPNAEEINKNIRARSAKLRVFETHSASSG